MIDIKNIIEIEKADRGVVVFLLSDSICNLSHAIKCK